MLKLLLNSTFIQFVPEGGWFDLPGGISVSPAHAGWSNADGYSLEAYEPEPEAPDELTLDDFRLAIDAQVEAVAVEWGYNSAAHIAGYVASTVPIWSAEALAFVSWRDRVWQQAIGQLALIEAGQVAPPASPAALVAILPAAIRPKGAA